MPQVKAYAQKYWTIKEDSQMRVSKRSNNKEVKLRAKYFLWSKSLFHGVEGFSKD